MRLHGPVSFKIEQVQSKKLRLKSQTGFYLNISGENDDGPWDYWANESVVRVDLLRSIPHDNEQRLTFTFPERLSAKLVPTSIFDSHTFVEELNCDVGLLFSMLAAPHSVIEFKLGKGKNRDVRLSLAIGKYYKSHVRVPFDKLKGFLKQD